MSVETKRRRLEDAVMPLLRCIKCGHGELRLDEHSVECPACATSFPVHENVPVMTLTPEDAMSFDRGVVVGNPYSEKWKELIAGSDGSLVLDLGSGNNPDRYENLIKLDVFPLPNVDVVGMAENLPFRDGVFRTVFSGAVFEHVLDPFLAIRQVHRVLRDDGEVYIETAFLQPVHAFPDHYFNMTRQGLEQICGSFAKLESGVQPHQYPSFMLAWVLGVWASKLGVVESQKFLGTKVREIIREYRKDPFSQRWMEGFSREDIEELACGVFFHGRKSTAAPVDLDVHPEPKRYSGKVNRRRPLRRILGRLLSRFV